MDKKHQPMKIESNKETCFSLKKIERDLFVPKYSFMRVRAEHETLCIVGN